MKPGDVTSGTVDVQNTGSLSGAFTLTRSALNDSDSTFPMSSQLNVQVRDCGDFFRAAPRPAAVCAAQSERLQRRPAQASTGTCPLSTYAANEQHRYEFIVTFAASANNDYQGDSSTATFTWNASSNAALDQDPWGT